MALVKGGKAAYEEIQAVRNRKGFTALFTSDYRHSRTVLLPKSRIEMI